MTLFQFWAVLSFVLGCIIITFLNNRKMIKVLKQRDRLASALTWLVQDAVRSAPHIHDALSVIAARKAIREVLGIEKVKE